MTRMHCRILSFLVLVLGCAAGCVAFTDDELPAISTWPPPAPQVKQAINVEVTGNVIGNLQADWVAHASRAMRDSELFAEVTASSRTDAPLRARLEVTMKVERSAWGILAGFLLYVPPTPLALGDFELKTEFLANGSSTGVVQRSESYTVWGGILSIFLVPFGTQESTVFYDAVRSTLVEARERNIIQ